jgi:tripeptide aminopeptidase
VRASTEAERTALGELFAELCAIPSPWGHEGAVGARVRAELEGLGLEVTEDGAAAAIGAGCGNLLARIPGPTDASVLLCAHLDTVPVAGGVVEPVLEDGGWTNGRDAILGADNKAAVAVMLQAARRFGRGGAPVGIELLLTVGEENALAGATAFDASVLRSAFGWVFDHATPIGELVAASPTAFRLEATFRGRAAHAGIRPQDGRSAVLGAARAIAAMRLGRLDDATTANVASVHGGVAGTNVVPDRCTILAEARSLSDAEAEETVGEMVDHLHDAANEPDVECDVDVGVQRVFSGYRHRTAAPPLVVAEAALRHCGYEPRRILSGGASDANALLAQGVQVACLANGTERAHEPDERVSVAALEGMLDVTYALLDAAARHPA